jgi:hypothetical protein
MQGAAAGSVLSEDPPRPIFYCVDVMSARQLLLVGGQREKKMAFMYDHDRPRLPQHTVPTSS